MHFLIEARRPRCRTLRAFQFSLKGKASLLIFVTAVAQTNRALCGPILQKLSSCSRVRVMCWLRRTNQGGSFLEFRVVICLAFPVPVQTSHPSTPPALLPR
eukprot:COSAG02_NODE_1043_length_15014_cov_8.766007_14_plen_101_part_00